jgi:hypothetical protein
MGGRHCRGPAIKACTICCAEPPISLCTKTASESSEPAVEPFCASDSADGTESGGSGSRSVRNQATRSRRAGDNHPDAGGECLSMHWFVDLAEAQQVLTAWQED